MKINRYKPLYPMNEAFAKGAHVKVIKLMAKILSRRVAGLDMDLDIPEGYKNSMGKFIAYTGWLKSGKQVRINFILGGNDKVHSIDILTATDKMVDGIVFEENDNIVQIINTAETLIKGNFEEMLEDFAKEDKELLMEKRVSAKAQMVMDWLLDPNFKSERKGRITSERLKNIFPDFIRANISAENLPTQATFIKHVKNYLKANGMTNPFVKARAKKKPKMVDIPIILPEEKKMVSAMNTVQKVMFTWREAFMDMEDDFFEMMDNPDSMPYGQLVYGNGGTGKSYFFNQQKSKFDMEIIKGAPNTARLIKLLYDYRNKDIIVFDDADSIVTTNNSAVVLKAALDDTVKRRVIDLPKGSGKDMAGIVPDVTDSNGELKDAFYFDASCVIITNLKDIKDKALKTRMYLNPIFMDKLDIIEKIKETSKPEQYGVTQAQADEVANLLASLVMTGEFDIKDDMLSYRFFKIGLKSIKRFPGRWQGRVMRKLGIGIKTSLPK